MPQAEPEPGRMRDRVRAGIAYIREKTVLRRLLIAQGAAFVFFAAVIPVEVVYAKETLGVERHRLRPDARQLGRRDGRSAASSSPASARPRSPACSSSAPSRSASATSAWPSAPTLAVACAASVVGGAGNGVQWVAAISAVQELTAEAMQARVMSVLESIGAAMPGVGFALGGVDRRRCSARERPFSSRASGSSPSSS